MYHINGEVMDFIDNLNSRLEKEINKGIVPGFSYGIIADKDYVSGIGFKQLVPNKEVLTPDSLYDVASLTKVVVIVTLICKLVDKKIISFNDNIKKYLPNFKYDDITIFHLLTHTSGLPSDLGTREIMSKKKIINLIYSKEKINEPGKQVLYSDLGYMLLGFMIEKIYSKKLNVVAQEEIFIPLEMNNTTYNPMNKDICVPTELTEERGLVKGVVHDEKAYSLGGIAGHAGVFSTVKDLMNFARMILNQGVYNDKVFLSKEMIDLWFKNIVYDKKCKWKRSFCWIVGKNDIIIEEGMNIISFNGFTGPSISIDRDKNIAIILMTNRIHPTRDNRKILKVRSLISNYIYQKIKEKNLKSKLEI